MRVIRVPRADLLASFETCSLDRKYIAAYSCDPGSTRRSASSCLRSAVDAAHPSQDGDSPLGPRSGEYRDRHRRPDCWLLRTIWGAVLSAVLPSSSGSYRRVSAGTDDEPFGLASPAGARMLGGYSEFSGGMDRWTGQRSARHQGRRRYDAPFNDACRAYKAAAAWEQTRPL
jgi:hypothetical protein